MHNTHVCTVRNNIEFIVFNYAQETQRLRIRKRAVLTT